MQYDHERGATSMNQYFVVDLVLVYRFQNMSKYFRRPSIQEEKFLVFLDVLVQVSSLLNFSPLSDDPPVSTFV